MKKLLKNAKILKSADGSIENKDIVINEDKIENIYLNGEIEDEKNFEVFDLENKLIVPGFINSHSHTIMSYFKGNADDMSFKEWLFENMLPREELLTPEMAYYGSYISQLEMIKNGITSFADMYMFTDQIAQAALKTGMRAFISRGLSYDNEKGWQKRIDENIETYKKYNNYFGRIKIGFGPHAPYTVNHEKLKEVSQLAKKYKTHIQIHLLESEWERKEYNLKKIEETGLFDNPTIAAHCVYIDDDDMHVLSRNNVTVSHNPSSNLKLGNGICPLTKLFEKNINITLGTDGSASNNSLDIMKEGYIASLLQKSKYGPEKIKINQILRMMWENSAYAFEEKIGRIESGYKADIAVLDLKNIEFQPLEDKKIKSHLIYSANNSNIWGTMINGEWKYYNKKLINIKLEEEKIYENFAKWHKKLEKDFINNNISND
ncbi:amidohydrolase [Oceanotoga sp. DSM 15011]|jgi:5-methylthioadenosine/S-adenosylhomocysteine deaminase|uniref:5-methylthioadenosine/S-adenosylhomocysteine deaminase n=1 Tax=Oceanotoga teriensis TaxID=515440 RepID=A0AA45C8F3_9BACT|nr:MULTISPECIES: amidohydrolase [Oceanotoga]MDN5342433.1 5-methylthioadenosine/S-adenosylhomocysteine deaminase [Oceanotoga sp.]MDO7975614.1 amidohydrolase [Oceanotoga teriensis]PWJ96097.1 5-methylthioadenosine/S-adenosylhomocysteine deaminase [Oceanotoga teriensis]UYO99879.1 amidohydrolase [Oceanotoga sp. DSM 15011]